MKHTFRHLADKVSTWAGSTTAFLLATLTVVVWLLAGPSARYSNTWLLTITVVSDVIIFLMVFLIQNTQNRDSRAVQLKLNELIVANNKARDTFIGLESLTDEELADIDSEFKRLLSTLEVAPAMKALHKKVAKEKERRTGNNLTDNIHKAEHLVGSLLLAPLGPKNTSKK